MIKKSEFKLSKALKYRIGDIVAFVCINDYRNDRTVFTVHDFDVINGGEFVYITYYDEQGRKYDDSEECFKEKRGMWLEKVTKLEQALK